MEQRRENDYCSMVKLNNQGARFMERFCKMKEAYYDLVAARKMNDRTPISMIVLFDSLKQNSCGQFEWVTGQKEFFFNDLKEYFDTYPEKLK